MSDLKQLEIFLRQHFPECILARKMHSTLLNLHKISSHNLWADWESDRDDSNGLLMILRKDLIVLDFDDAIVAKDWEDIIPAFRQTSMQKTQKGVQYFFKRTPECDAMKISNTTRNLVDSGGNILPIDVKTVCVTGMTRMTNNNKSAIVTLSISPHQGWIRPLWTHPPIDIPDELVHFIDMYRQDKPEPVAMRQTRFRHLLHQTRRFLSHLSKERSRNYLDWISVGWCLHSIDPKTHSLLDDWIAFSKRCPEKYKEGECEQHWLGFKIINRTGLHIGTLRMWARQDCNRMIASGNLVDLDLDLDLDLESSALACDSIANFAHKLLASKFVCASASGKLWYIFNGTFWHVDEDCVQLRRELSIAVRDQYNTRYSTNISMNIKEKNRVLKEMRKYFYDPTFLKKHETQSHFCVIMNVR